MKSLKIDQNLFRLKELEECPVLEFFLDFEHATIDLVVFTDPNTLSGTFEENVAQATSKPYDREFARFRFFDIGDFRKKGGAKQFINQTHFHANSAGVNAIHGILVSKSGNKHAFAACLSNFGSVEFSFHNVQFASRQATIVKEEAVFSHYDVLTNELIDFLQSFSRMLRLARNSSLIRFSLQRARWPWLRQNLSCRPG